MKWAISKLSQLPVRFSPSEKAEMVNQILFGETIEVLDTYQTWKLIRTTHDHYEGWISTGQITDMLHFTSTESEPYASLLQSNQANVLLQNGSIIPISMGSAIRRSDHLTTAARLYLPNTPWDVKTQQTVILDCARSALGSPYLWGGRSIFGYDCSGFTQVVFGLAGINLPRDAHEQAKHGVIIDFIDEAAPGDLAFFDNEEGVITHVAILTDSKNVIHASGFVRYDSIDHNGIFNQSVGKYTHKLRIIKRIIQ